jgi:hypothetical protein
VIASRRFLRANTSLALAIVLQFLWVLGSSSTRAQADISRNDREFVFGLNPIHIEDGPFGYELGPEPFDSQLQRQARLGAEATRLWTIWGAH